MCFNPNSVRYIEDICCSSLSLGHTLRLPSGCVYRLAVLKTLSQSRGCGFQNEATITASTQMPLDLTFHARRELPFQVPANQMDGHPTRHIGPTFSGPAWVGPFSSQQGAIRHWRKAVHIWTLGLAFALLASVYSGPLADEWKPHTRAPIYCFFSHKSMNSLTVGH